MVIYSCLRVQASARGWLRSGTRPTSGNKEKAVGSDAALSEPIATLCCDD